MRSRRPCGDATHRTGTVVAGASNTLSNSSYASIANWFVCAARAFLTSTANVCRCSYGLPLNASPHGERTSTAPPRFERGSPDSKSGVLPIAPRGTGRKEKGKRQKVEVRAGVVRFRVLSALLPFAFFLLPSVPTASPRFERGLPDPESGVRPVTPRGNTRAQRKTPKPLGFGVRIPSNRSTSSPGAQRLLALLDLLLPECVSRCHHCSFYRLSASKVN